MCCPLSGMNPSVQAENLALGAYLHTLPPATASSALSFLSSNCRRSSSSNDRQTTTSFHRLIMCTSSDAVNLLITKASTVIGPAVFAAAVHLQKEEEKNHKQIRMFHHRERVSVGRFIAPWVHEFFVGHFICHLTLFDAYIPFYCRIFRRLPAE
jgi:hypothetical protein